MANPIAQFLRGKTETLLSPLSPDDCAARLRQGIDGDLMIFGSKPFRGSVSGTTARIRKRIAYRNSFQTVVRVTMESQPRGTALTCKSGFSIFVILFLAVWFGMLSLFLLGSLGDLLGGAPGAGDPLFVLAPLGMMAFGVGLVAFGGYLGRNEHAEIVAFVQRTTQAKAEAAKTSLGRQIVE